MNKYLHTLIATCLIYTSTVHAGFQEFDDITTDNVVSYDNTFTGCIPYKADVTYVYYETNSYWSNHGTRHHVDSDFRLNQAAYSLAYNAGPAIFSVATAFDNVHDPRIGNRSGFEDIEFDISSFWRRCNGTEATLAFRSIIPAGHAKREIRFGRFGVGIEFTEIKNDCEEAIVYGSTVGYMHYFGFPADRLYYYFLVEKSLLPCVSLAGALKFDFSLRNGSSQGDLTLFYNDPNERVIRAELKMVTFAIEDMQFDIGAFWNIWGRNVGTGVGFMCHASARF